MRVKCGFYPVFLIALVPALGQTWTRPGCCFEAAGAAVIGQLAIARMLTVAMFLTLSSRESRCCGTRRRLLLSFFPALMLRTVGTSWDSWGRRPRIRVSGCGS